MTTDLITTSTDLTTSTPKASRRTNRARLVLVSFLAAIVSIVGIVGVASPASAAPLQVYASSTINGMWHSGSTQYWNANRNFNLNVRFNDRGGDNFCTQLKYRVSESNGAVTTFTGVSVCGGRSGSVSYTVYAGSTITRVQIWTVRADGAFGSYVWDFRP
jgi:hypothetical protein